MTSESPGVIRVTHAFTASAERVFDAWINPEKVARWLLHTAGKARPVGVGTGADESIRCIACCAGRAVEHTVEHLEIQRPYRLSFTIRNSASAEKERVTVLIEPRGAGCFLTLISRIEQAPVRAFASFAGLETYRAETAVRSHWPPLGSKAVLSLGLHLAILPLLPIILHEPSPSLGAGATTPTLAMMTVGIGAEEGVRPPQRLYVPPVAAPGAPSEETAVPEPVVLPPVPGPHTEAQATLAAPPPPAAKVALLPPPPAAPDGRPRHSSHQRLPGRHPTLQRAGTRSPSRCRAPRDSPTGPPTSEGRAPIHPARKRSTRSEHLLNRPRGQTRRPARTARLARTMGCPGIEHARPRRLSHLSSERAASEPSVCRQTREAELTITMADERCRSKLASFEMNMERRGFGSRSGREPPGPCP
jgi:uncharacterized protein YndB with AHSA1/START domain